MKKKSINPCKVSIIKTLSYSSFFGFPLSIDEIISNLISQSKPSEKLIKKNLEELVNAKIVRKTKGRYIIYGIKSVDRDKRSKNTSKILEENKAYLQILSKIPWIKMIALTGSVANQNADEGADIDLLFITESNRLWICRGLVFVVLKIIGKLPSDKSKRDICPNIFMEEKSLSWSKKKRNLYVAQNIISMKPYLWRDDIYLDFKKANSWVCKYYPNFIIDSPKSVKKKKVKNNFIMNFIESLAMKLQILYMKREITTETVNKELIHFNKNDSTKRVLLGYKKVYKDALRKLEDYLENDDKVKDQKKEVGGRKTTRKKKVKQGKQSKRVRATGEKRVKTK